MTKVTAGQETGQGAGALLICETTQRALLLKRSNEGDAGGTWCCGGGGIDATDVNHLHTIGREYVEEAGINVPMRLIYVGKVTYPNGFVFHNYIGIIADEVTPVLNDEHTDFIYADISEIIERKLSLKMHPGFMVAMDSSRAREILFNEFNYGNPALFENGHAVFNFGD